MCVCVCVTCVCVVTSTAGYPVELIPTGRSIETLKAVLRGFKNDVEKVGLEGAQEAALEKAASRRQYVWLCVMGGIVVVT